MAKAKSKGGHVRNNDPTKRFSERVKKAAARRVFEGQSTLSQEAIRVGCSAQSVSYWVQKFHTGATSARDAQRKTAAALDKRADAEASELPTLQRTSRASRAKAKPLVPIAFQCPHCGGGIEVAA